MASALTSMWQASDSTAMWRIIEIVSELFGAYDTINISKLHDDPEIRVTDKDGGRLNITGTDEPGYDVSVEVIFTIDNETINATYLVAFGSEIIVTSVNNEILPVAHVIAQYDNTVGMIFDNTKTDDDMIAFLANQDLFEMLLSIM